MAIEDGKLVQKTIDPSPKTLGPPPTIVPSPATFAVTAEFSGGAIGFAGIVGTGKEGHGVYVVNADTGALAGMVNTAGDGNVSGRAISPDGRVLAVTRDNSSALPENIDLYTVADGRKTASFKPHYDRTARKTDLVMSRFVAVDKLLTITSTGGFAEWSVSDQTKLITVPGTLKPGTIKQSWSSPMPGGFDVSQDGKVLALFDGRGYTFYDTSTGNSLVKTEPVIAEGEFAAGPAAFRADGSRLAALFLVGKAKPPTTLVVVWDASTGKKVSEFKPAMDDNPDWASVQWFGPDHVLVRLTGGGKSRVWSVENPRQVTEIVALTLPGSPGDKLWAHVGKSNVIGREPPDAPKFLISGSPPPLGNHPKLWFTYRGFSPSIPMH